MYSFSKYHTLTIHFEGNFTFAFSLIYSPYMLSNKTLHSFVINVCFVEEMW
ncbi:hypothetical protein IX324_002754 [Bacteroides pyogenes]|nr:hypothetical protein [Bacteroides pyogenes]